MPLIRNLPAEARRTITEAVLRERLTDGWDLPHQLSTVSLTFLGGTTPPPSAKPGDYGLVGVETRAFPLDISAVPGDALYEKLNILGQSIVTARTVTKTDPPLPEDCAGILLLAEAWVSVRDKPLAEDEPAPSKDPNRREGLSGYFVSNDAAFCLGMTLRGEDEVEIRDIEDMSSDELDGLMSTRLLPPLVALWMGCTMPLDLLETAAALGKGNADEAADAAKRFKELFGE